MKFNFKYLSKQSKSVTTIWKSQCTADKLRNLNVATLVDTVPFWIFCDAEFQTPNTAQDGILGAFT